MNDLVSSIKKLKCLSPMGACPSIEYKVNKNLIKIANSFVVVKAEELSSSLVSFSSYVEDQGCDLGLGTCILNSLDTLMFGDILLKAKVADVRTERISEGICELVLRDLYDIKYSENVYVSHVFDSKLTTIRFKFKDSSLGEIIDEIRNFCSKFESKTFNFEQTPEVYRSLVWHYLAYCKGITDSFEFEGMTSKITFFVNVGEHVLERKAMFENFWATLEKGFVYTLNGFNILKKTPIAKFTEHGCAIDKKVEDMTKRFLNEAVKEMEEF